MEPRQPYPTDLSDKEWDLIQHLVPTAKPGGRPEKYPKREILEAIFSILRGGCAWRLLPLDFCLSVGQRIARRFSHGSWPRPPSMPRAPGRTGSFLGMTVRGLRTPGEQPVCENPTPPIMHGVRTSS
jgi:transposase